MSLCNNCIHEEACKAQYQYDSGYFYFENGNVPTSFEETVPTECALFDDKSYYLRPKYRVNDKIWTLDKDNTGTYNKVNELIIEEIKYDHAEYDYLLSNGEWEQETELFNTKTECVAFLKDAYGKEVED